MFNLDEPIKYDTDLFEIQYAKAINNVINNGVLTHNRTGIDTLSIQHQYFKLDVRDFELPLLKGKKVYPYMSLKEVLWMLQGRTDIKWLNDHGVTYWDEWKLKDGTIGKSYGYQYRNFNGVDQIQKLVNDIIHNPESRRLIVSLWNPADMDQMALPPCEFEYHFSCIPINNQKYEEYDVDLHCRMRSADSFLGVPYNFLFSAYFLFLICNYCTNSFDNRDKNGYRKKFYNPRYIHLTCDDFHIYTNHINQAKQYLMNVKENKNHIIDSEVECFIKPNIDENHNIFESIDKYLKAVSDDLKTHELIHIHKWQEDVYGPIKADIAV